MGALTCMRFHSFWSKVRRSDDSKILLSRDMYIEQRYHTKTRNLYLL